MFRERRRVDRDGTRSLVAQTGPTPLSEDADQDEVERTTSGGRYVVETRKIIRTKQVRGVPDDGRSRGVP